ncbi:uncharacterized protein LOC117609291 [Osmia lignaria lignaria]|uniref:uncharacterized protein LOC117609291 n=1 Tax=Osmia lignaria lignaria TaxID=1437193 RepID=UPI00402BDE4C
MIRWSPSVDRKSPRFSLTLSKLTLFPPFVHKNDESFFETTKEKPKKTRRDRRPPTKKETISLGDNISTCKSHLAESSAKNDPAEYVLCKDDCGWKTMTCKELHDTIEEETKKFTRVIFDIPHEDQEEEEEYEFEDETDPDEEKDEMGSWELGECESFSSLSDNEEEPNTTDPCMSHELYLPYYKIQRPRYFESTNTESGNIIIRLPRRPRSPVRQILPDKFELKNAYMEWDRKRRVSERRKYLEESKERISYSIGRLSMAPIDERTLISSMVLQMVCEQVTLTLMDVEIDVDVQTFVNIAAVWALSELDIFDYGGLLDERYTQPENARFFNWKQQDIIDVMGTGGMRKILMGAYRPPFNRNLFTNFHRRLPWPSVSPSHARGYPKFYPNVRERIDEKTKGSEEAPSKLTHVPNLTCFHLREVLDKSYVAYRRKSKSFFLRFFSTEEKSDLFIQLLSLM